MGVLSLIAIYFVIWWTVLFAILPIGVRSQADDNDIILGTTHSAPQQPRLLFKALLTTLVSALVMAALYVAVEVFGITFNSLPHIIPGT
ncbi:DUF1467 family protein [Aureimonas fodinaquatilis]|uniref:DUF1467 family protein n=1 Tax=Aureimonas fodinaquatilis TaxID=2565783 RepID=A0A5B0DWB4_9HYPH|nr:DUF1467 family protein [Aureimonas fodinaquatilis]KAA0970658.1 DUF1467 family protein [Aureimonas fodinaquatilis]